MKKSIILLLTAMSVFLSLAQTASAQSKYEQMSGSARRAYIRELSYIDYTDITLSSAEAATLKADLLDFGNHMMSSGNKLTWWGFLGVGLGGCTLLAVTGAALNCMPVAYASVGCLAVGVTMGYVGLFRYMKGERFVENSRQVIVDATTYPLNLGNLAIGTTTSLNRIDQTRTFGPAVCIRF